MFKKISFYLLYIFVNLALFSCQNKSVNTNYVDLYLVPEEPTRSYINKSGKVIATNFLSRYNFSEGLAAVKGGEKYSAEEIEYSENIKYGYINHKGDYKIKPKFINAKPFSEGLAAVSILDKESDNENYGYIDRKGKFVIKPIFRTANPFVNGFAKVKTDDNDDYGYQYIDVSGNFILDLRDIYTSGDFHEEVAWFQKTQYGRYGFFNIKGKIIIEPKYEKAYNFSDGLALVQMPNIFDRSKNSLTKNSDKYGFINKEGEFVIEPIFDDARPFSEGLASVKIDGLYGYINTLGEIVIPPQWEAAYSFSEGKAAVSSKVNTYNLIEELSYISPDGSYVIKNITEKLDITGGCGVSVPNEFLSGLALVKSICHKMAYIDTNGTSIWQNF